MIRTLTSKDFLKFFEFCTNSNNDSFADFYITKDNERKFISDPKVAKKVFSSALKHGDKCYLLETDGIIRGIFLIVGYADKFNRKYIKVIAENEQALDDLFKGVSWQVNTDLWLKVKKENPVAIIAKRWGFRFQGSRGKEILLSRNFNAELAEKSKFVYVKEEDLIDDKRSKRHY